MDNSLNFGANWDPSTLLDERTLLDDLNKSVDHKKISAKDLKEANFLLLTSYIKEQDSQGIVDFFKTNPSFDISSRADGFIKIALDNFNASVMDSLYDKVEISDFYKIEKIVANQSLSMLSYFLDKTKDQALDLDDKINKDYISNLGSYEGNKHEFNVRNKHLSSWSRMHSGFLKNKMSDFEIKAIEFMDNNYPLIKQSSLFFDNTLFTMLKQNPKNGSWKRNYLAKVPLKAWERMFYRVFPNRTYFKSDNFTINNLSFLVSFLKENKDIKNIWNDTQKYISQEHNKWKDWYDKFIPEDKLLEDTPFVRIMNNLDYSKSFAGNRSTAPFKTSVGSFGPDFTSDTLRPTLSGETHLQLLSTKNAIGTNGLMRLFPSIGFTNIQFDHLKKIDSNIEGDIETGPITYIPDSFMHTLVEAASPILSYLIRKDESRLAIQKCLENPYSAYFFARNSTSQMFISTIKAIPSLIDYRDLEGNSLAYIHVKVRRDKTKGCALGLLSLSSQWFVEPNKQNVTLFDVFQLNGLPPSYLLELEKKIITTAMKDDEITATKLRSRTKYSAPKRKI